MMRILQKKEKYNVYVNHHDQVIIGVPHTSRGDGHYLGVPLGHVNDDGSERNMNEQDVINGDFKDLEQAEIELAYLIYCDSLPSSEWESLHYKL